MSRNAPVLSINQPCHESWQHMTPNANGRHCASCAKTVIDLSLLSDQEIRQLIKTANGSFCGRAHNGQLNRIIDDPASLTRVSLLRKMLAGVVAFTLLHPAKAKTSEPQNTPAPSVDYALYAARQLSGETAPNIAEDTTVKTVRGRILDSATREPLEGISITLAGTRITTLSNTKGEFSLRLPTANTISDVELTVSAVGYERATFTIPTGQLDHPKTWTIQIKGEMSLGIVEIVYRKKRWWQIWK